MFFKIAIRLSLASGAAIAACNGAQLTPAPAPASAEPCPTAPVIYCDASAGQGGCTSTADASDPGTGRFPQTAYPLGCTAALLGSPRADDGTCPLTNSCACEGEDGGSPAWTCR